MRYLLSNSLGTPLGWLRSLFETRGRVGCKCTRAPRIPPSEQQLLAFRNISLSECCARYFLLLSNMFRNTRTCRMRHSDIDMFLNTRRCCSEGGMRGALVHLHPTRPRVSNRDRGHPRGALQEGSPSRSKRCPPGFCMRYLPHLCSASLNCLCVLFPRVSVRVTGILTGSRTQPGGGD